MVSAVTRAVPELEAHLAAAPVPAQPRADQLAAIRPAFEAFGAALHRAAAAERRPAAASRLAPGLGDQAIIAAAPTVTLTLSDQPAIDTTAPHWPEAMIARIERLRDEHNAPGGAGDTRIRLHPDALGPIDVTLRRDGDAVQVQLRAAEPATRALLAEAQPRLNELAEARGLRLTGTDLASGTAQGGQGWTGDRRQPAPAPAPLPTRPSRQSANDTADDDPTDTRLA